MFKTVDKAVTENSFVLEKFLGSFRCLLYDYPKPVIRFSMFRALRV